MKRITIQMKCPKCDNSSLEHDGGVHESIFIGTYLPKYSHTCKNCYHYETLSRPYPYTYDKFEPHELETRVVTIEENEK